MKFIQLLSFSTLMICSSCDHFLDEKPDIKMVIPKTVNDCDLLLNDYATLNMGYPAYGEWGADDYFLTKENWESISNNDQRNAYIWADEPYTDVVQWQRPYKAVYLSNQVLETLQAQKEGSDDAFYQKVSGGAYFYRAFAFHQLIEVYAPAYEKERAVSELGIPLRMDPGIDEISTRASLEDSYKQVIADYKLSINQLPIQEPRRGRPDRAAAYAGMARVYLDMARYEDAYHYADSCLKLRAELMDFNTLPIANELPISRFNMEVLFSAVSTGAGPMAFNLAAVDLSLINQYAADDMRKQLFFQPNQNAPDTYSFRGNYDNSYSQLFVGLTTSEVYLIKAEAAIRTGRVNEALSALNALLETRWKTNTYVAIKESDPEVLLEIILLERRKELLFRGRRWADLKRLNLEPRFQRTLIRHVNGEKYELAPNSTKYAFRLPEPVIDLGNIPQNRR
ncbi:RagB/SusD family nutrient uptake outer membrane protein [Sphingobacterium puteale]|uniref:RagB/SusD family nutrient uptake outer membrane protein n=1 Tax=Sphingobacterium puteale TaxID=2420510 RepID=A0A420VTP2_9SPHI|nr:RagB/SusD family nutrient uptake outer membrane protein [Sphingobacterium puteale]RKO69748.1 RagB/SusD family nutrient uptake outer membrane protein [Sphingobacterium puteale]